MIKMGIVGTGNSFAIAGYHLKAFLRIPDVEVAAVCSRKKERAEAFVREKHITAEVCATYEELLEKVDAVCICTPNDMHAGMALQALKAGKGVLCEKPMAGTEAEMEELLEYTKRIPYGHLVGFNYRYSPENRTMKKLVEDGRLGHIYTFYQRKGGNRLANITVPYEWRMDKEKSGMGAGIDFGSHMLDNFFYISGYEPEMLEKVTVQTETYVKNRKDETGKDRIVDTDDMALLTLRMKDGCRAVLDCNRVGLAYEELQVIGSEGIAFYSGMKPGEIHFWKKEENGAFSKEPEILLLEEGEDTYYLQALAWVKAMKDKKSADPDLSLGCVQAQIFKKIQKAAEEYAD